MEKTYRQVTKIDYSCRKNDKKAFSQIIKIVIKVVESITTALHSTPWAIIEALAFILNDNVNY